MIGRSIMTVLAAACLSEKGEAGEEGTNVIRAASNLVPEAEILEAWPMLPAAMLRKARRKGEVSFYQFPGGPHYKILDVEEFIERKFKVCAESGQQPSQSPQPLPPIPRPPVGNTADIISTTPIQSAEDTGTPADTMSENERLRAEVFESEILNRPKRPSSRLSKKPLSKSAKRPVQKAS